MDLSFRSCPLGYHQRKTLATSGVMTGRQRTLYKEHPGFASPQTANLSLFVVVIFLSLPPQVHRTSGSLSFLCSSEKAVNSPTRQASRRLISPIKTTHHAHVRIPRYRVSGCHPEHGLVDSGRGFACLQAMRSFDLLPQVSCLFGQCAYNCVVGTRSILMLLLHVLQSYRGFAGEHTFS